MCFGQVMSDIGNKSRDLHAFDLHQLLYFLARIPTDDQKSRPFNGAANQRQDFARKDFIGYALTNKLIKRYGITKLRFYISGENLAEIKHTNVPLDPEITDASSTSGFTGRVYPFMRTYSGGLQLSF